MSDEKIRCKVTDTKQNILKAYKAHLEDINSRASTTVSTTAVAAQKKTANAVTTAKSVKPQDIETQALELQKGVISQIREVVDGLADRKAKFDELDQAIAAKNSELKEVFGIEQEANALSALLEAQKASKEQAQSEVQTMLDEAREEAAEILDEAKTEAQEIEDAIAEKQRVTAQKHKRDEEEYNYNFARTKVERENELNDQLALKARSLDDREEAVTTRETKMTELEGTVTKLTDELATTKASIDDQIKAAKDAATKSAEKSAAIAANIAKSKHESELQIKDHQINSLEATVSQMRTDIARLQGDLDKANSKVQEVAMQALQSKAEASRPLVVGGSDGDSKKR